MSPDEQGDDVADDDPSRADPNRGIGERHDVLDAGPPDHTPAEATPSSASSLPPGADQKPD